ncbi:uncharacterized protein ACRADG_010996 [Cochliomyia hominivorax]
MKFCKMETKFKEELMYDEMIDLEETKIANNDNVNINETEDAPSLADTAEDDDKKLYEFLEDINMETIFMILKANQVTFQSLRYLKNEDLKEAVPPLGLRVEFREKLFAWQKSQLFTIKENNINFNNVFHNSHHLTTLQTVHNSSVSESVTCAQPVSDDEIEANISKTIQPILVRLTNEVTSLRQEVNYLRNEIKGLKKETSVVKLVMPENPYKSMDDFLHFEKQLQNDKNLTDSFVKELQTVAKTPNFVKNCWRKLLMDELAENLCWKGTEEKKSVRSLSTSKAIKYAAISIGLREDEFIKHTKSFFQFAKNRQICKAKYKEKSKTLKN